MAISVEVDDEIYKQLRSDLLKKMNELNSNALSVSQPRLMPKNTSDTVQYRRYLTYRGASPLNKKLLLLL